MAAITVTAANVAPGSNVVYGEGIAGATITAGQVLYIDATDGNKLKLADADASEAAASHVGVAAHGASSGQPIKYFKQGNFNPGATVAVGTIYLVGSTAGAINPHGDLTSGWYARIIGVATTTSNIQMLPNNIVAQVP